MKKIIIIAGMFSLLASSAQAQVLFEYPMGANDYRRNSDDSYWRQIRLNQEAEQRQRRTENFGGEGQENRRHEIYEKEHHDDNDHYNHGKKHPKKHPKKYKNNGNAHHD